MKKKKQSLDAKRANIFMVDPDALYMEREPGKKHYDTRVNNGFNERIVVGMLEFGVKQTVSVEKCGDKIVVIDGRQRVINAREAKRRQVESGAPSLLVPCKVERGDEAKLFKIGIITNEHRIPEDVVSQAHKIQAYMDKGYSEDDAAELWGMTPQTVRNRLKVLELSPAVQAAIVSKEIKVTKALKLRGLSHADQDKKLNAPAPAARPRTRRPKKKHVEAVLAGNGHVNDTVKAAILWVRGEIDNDAACKRIKGLQKVLASLEENAT